jgi:hypothetical protein
MITKPMYENLQYEAKIRLRSKLVTVSAYARKGIANLKYTT